MALSPRLEIQQTQQLAMTQELRQAIGLLRLTSQELREFVEAEVEQNPFLEMEAMRDGPGRMPELQMGLGSPEGPEQAAPEQELRESLLGQLRLMDADPGLVAIAARLVMELDDDGFLRLDNRELTLALEQPYPRIEEALRLVQACDPIGVGARSLSECFGLQLREMGELNPVSMAVLTRLELYAKQGAEAVAAQITNADEDAVEAVMMIVRTLDRAPGTRVSAEPVQMAVPDVTITRDNMGGWVVELLHQFQPKVRIDTIMAAKTAESGEEEAAYVSSHTRRAKWLARSLEQRGRTVLQVASEIVRVQAGFFETGPSHLKPLTLRTVAESLGIHESTVSRVTRGKYLTCARGTFELKYFFSKALSGRDGRGDRSALAVRERIRKLIAGEGPERPLSDDAITEVLKAEGTEIARRTVAKYREAMHIPASHARKRLRTRSGGGLIKVGARNR